jgi:hypothetical protein
MAIDGVGAWLADLVLAVHVAIAVSIVAGLLLVWIGAAAGWRWVRNPWLRASHLAAIAYVAIQAVAGRICPLTTWEDRLRGVRTERGFIERHLSALLYWDLPPVAFTTMYVAFALLVALTMWRVPPRPFRRRAAPQPPAGEGATRSP